MIIVVVTYLNIFVVGFFMELRYYDSNSSSDDSLIHKLKVLDDKAFGTGPNIVGITEDEIKKILNNGFIICAVIDGRIVSLLMVEYKTDSWYAAGIATDPKYLRGGLGSALMLELIKRAGNNRITATVRENNLESIGLCVNKNGFIITEFLKDHYGPGKDRLLLELIPGSKAYTFSKEFEEASCNDKERIKHLLDDGYLGTKLIKRPDGYYFLFNKLKYS